MTLIYIYIIKPFDKNVYAIANFIQRLIHVNRMQLKLNNCNLRLPFNHCTILHYNSHSNIKRCSKMGYHYDTQYDDKVHSIPWINSQVHNTPTEVVIFCDNRKLH